MAAGVQDVLVNTNEGLDSARRAAREVGDNPVFDALARWGFVMSGLLHIVIGYTAARLAWGGGGSADQSGALATLASNPAGVLVMWVIVIGLVALVVWQLTVAIAPGAGGGWLDRGEAVAKAAVYAVLAITAARFALGSGSSQSSEKSSQDVTANLMEQPAGQVLVGAVGVVIVGVGGYHVYSGLSRTFLQDLEEDPGTPARVLGMIGYPAKGIVLGLVGVFFVMAAVQHESSKAAGLDGALKSLRDEPFGPYLLTAVGVGFVAFGLYLFARARHQRI